MNNQPTNLSENDKKTTVLLIRHGQTDWNVAGRWQGHLDIPLNDIGVAQAGLLARRIARLPISAIYSSDLQRAAQTARIVGRALQIEPRYDPDLRERNGGDFQGLTTAELEQHHGLARRQMRESGMAPPGGESNLEVAERISAVFEEIIKRHRGETVAIVSHGGSLNLLIAYLLGFALGQPARISLRRNTGLSIVEIDQTGPRLTLLNDANHLAVD